MKSLSLKLISYIELIWNTIVYCLLKNIFILSLFEGMFNNQRWLLAVSLHLLHTKSLSSWVNLQTELCVVEQKLHIPYFMLWLEMYIIFMDYMIDRYLTNKISNSPSTPLYVHFQSLIIGIFKQNHYIIHETLQ